MIYLKNEGNYQKDNRGNSRANTCKKGEREFVSIY